MKVGFTGTQVGMNEKQLQRLRDGLRWLINRYGIDEAHHGDCIGGDLQFHRLCIALTLIPKIVIHPPSNSSKRAFCSSKHSYEVIIEERNPLPYLDRNKSIVLETNFLFVGPKSNQEELRSGTWSTYRFAKKVKGNASYDLLER